MDRFVPLFSMTYCGQFIRPQCQSDFALQQKYEGHKHTIFPLGLEIQERKRGTH